jgi:CubicO group peptidase (beta-lactamase class C family)
METDQLTQIVAEAGLSGAVRVDVGGRSASAAGGFADRAHRIPNTPDTRFAMASGCKAFTALVVMTLVERGELALATTARTVLGDDLPLVDDRVTIEHLVTHRSGIGDHVDEELDAPIVDDTGNVPSIVRVDALDTEEAYVPVLAPLPMKFTPGERFGYCNSGFVLLALIAGRVSGVEFPDLVQQIVFDPAGMTDSAYLRSDRLPGDAALGYIDDELRTNVFHLPVRGTGDGGAYTTLADMRRFWDAVTTGAIVAPDTFTSMIEPTTVDASDGLSYGRGFWIDPARRTVSVHGFDAGVGLVSTRASDDRFTLTVVANTNRGAWPMSETLLDRLAAPSDERRDQGLVASLIARRSRLGSDP